MDDYSKLKYLITLLMLHTPVIQIPEQASWRNNSKEHLQDQEQKIREDKKLLNIFRFGICPLYFGPATKLKHNWYFYDDDEVGKSLFNYGQKLFQ